MRFLFKILLLTSLVIADFSDEFCLIGTNIPITFQRCTTESPQTSCPIYTYPGGYVAGDVSVTWVDSTSSSGLYPNCTMAGFPSDTCQTNCMMRPPVIGCSGTSQYCSVYNCSSQYSCYCNLFGLASTPFLVVGDDRYPVNVTWYPCATIQPPSDVSPGMQRRSLSSSNVFVTFDDPNVFIQNSDGIQLNVIVTKDDYRALYSTEQAFVGYPIPSQYLVSSGTIYVDVYTGSVLTVSFSYDFVGTTICRLKSCILCVDAISNFNCLPTIYKVIVIFVLLVLASLVLAFVPPLLYGVMMLAKCVITPTIWTLKTSANLWKKKVRPMDRLNTVYNRVNAVNDDVEAAQQQVPVRRGARPKGRLNLMLIAICCLSCTNAICVTSGTITATMTNCIVGGGSCPASAGILCQTCSTSLVVQSTIPIVGGSACYQVLDQNGTLRGSLEVKYVQMIQKVSLSKAYHTSGYTVMTQAVKRCYDPVSSSSTCKANSCSNISNDRTAYGNLIVPDVVGRPGRVRCDPGCGCANCGCFYCTSSCLYSGYGIIPTIPHYEVDTFSLVSFEPKVQFNFTDAFGNSIVVATSIVGVSVTTSNISFMTLGTYQNNLQLFGSNSVVWKDATHAYLAPAALVNSPFAGQIGDIQANTDTSLNLVSPTAFTFDPAIMTANVGPSSVSYTQTNPGINNLLSLGKQLPQVLGGSVWSFSPGYLSGNLTNPGALVTQVTLSNFYKIAVSTASVCPSFTFVVGSGCYSCVTGVAVIISARSTCFPGTAAVISSDPDIIINTPVVILETTMRNYTIYVQTGKSSNSFNLSVVATTTASAIISFTAVEDSTVGNVTLNGTNTETQQDGWFDSASSFFSNLGSTIAGFFEDIFSGIASWWEYIIFVVIVIAVGVALFFGVNFLYKIIKIRGYSKLKQR